jgi:hypothetical protein
MFAIQEPPTPTPRKHRNKGSKVKQESKILQDDIGDIVVTPNQKRRERNRNNQKNTFHHSDVVSPLTSPYQQPVVSTEITLNDITNANASAKKGRKPKKKKENKQDGTVQAASSTFTPRSPPAEPSQPVATPLKQANQMYAGPTFHASPAPSSLPIPKFFAQSMQQVSVPSDDSSQDSSDQAGGDSPTLRSTMKVAEKQPREPSPLDIFFKADREEKAQRASGNGMPFAGRAQSASPSTDSFSAQTPKRDEINSRNTSPLSFDDINRAKTEALKQLLFLPQAQRSSPNVSHGVLGSPFELPPRVGSGGPASESSTPTRNIRSSDSPHTRPFYDFPNLPTPPSSLRGNQQRRPLPYHLRQEYLNTLPLEQSRDVPSQANYVAPVRH